MLYDSSENTDRARVQLDGPEAPILFSNRHPDPDHLAHCSTPDLAVIAEEGSPPPSRYPQVRKWQSGQAGDYEIFFAESSHG